MSNQGIRVVVACAGINLALGVLSSWHVAKAALLDVLVRNGDAGTTLADLGDLYWVACLAYAFAMVPAGRLLAEISPRGLAILGGVLVSLGFLLVGAAQTYVAWLVGFGVIGGVGVGFCHATTIPTALRWFPRTQSGLIAGVVVSGYSLAAMVVAPLASWLIARCGAQNAMSILGAGVLVIVSVLAQFLAVPSMRPTLFAAASVDDRGVSHVLRSPATWLLWAAFFVSGGTGLMVGGLLSDLAQSALGKAAFAAVVVMAMAGTLGRVVVGAGSDRWGRLRTLTALLAAQAVGMLVAALVAGLAAPPAAVVLALIGLIAFNYGGSFSLFPALIRDRCGLQHFGVIYGVIFTAWGVGGFAMSRLGEALHDLTQSHRLACLLACVMLLASAAISRRLHARAPVSTTRELAGVPPARSTN